MVAAVSFGFFKKFFCKFVFPQNDVDLTHDQSRENLDAKILPQSIHTLLAPNTLKLVQRHSQSIRILDLTNYGPTDHCQPRKCLFGAIDGRC